MKVRVRRLLAALNLDGKGLEYGPLDKVIVSRSMCSGIKYIDFADRAHLLEKCASNARVNLDAIPEIDIVTDGQPITDFVEDGTQDFVIASHVLEHVPDLVGWLKQNLGLLKAGGHISIAFPDRRYCLDIARSGSRVSELLAAHLEQRTRPSFTQICDFVFNARRVDAASAWSGTLTAENAEFVHPRPRAFAILRERLTSHEYFDAHCWTFADYEFFEMLEEVKVLFKLPFEVVSFIPTKRNGLEFLVTLEKTGAAAGKRAETGGATGLRAEAVKQGLTDSADNGAEVL